MLENSSEAVDCIPEFFQQDLFTQPVGLPSLEADFGKGATGTVEAMILSTFISPSCADLSLTSMTNDGEASRTHGFSTSQGKQCARVSVSISTKHIFWFFFCFFFSLR